MTVPAPDILRTIFAHRHLLAVQGLREAEITAVLDLAEDHAGRPDRGTGIVSRERGRRIATLFPGDDAGARAPFTAAAQRLGAEIVPLPGGIGSAATLSDLAAAVDAVDPDLLVLGHPEPGTAVLLAARLRCAVLNAGDGAHEHPVRALAVALALRRHRGALAGLVVTIVGDLLHSGAGRSVIHLLNAVGARVRAVAPPTLLPPDIDRLGAEIFPKLRDGLDGADAVLVLPLRRESIGRLVPSAREYFHFFGLDRDRLKAARPGAPVLHPEPLTADVEADIEIDAGLAEALRPGAETDGPAIAVATACLDLLTRGPAAG